MKPEFYSRSEAPVTFLIGGAGAGKTELSLNLSAWKINQFKQVSLIDLDIVNPFFRVRKLREEMEKIGINLITPIKKVVNGDIPGLPGAAWGAIENPGNAVVCDIGGGEPGLRPLGRMAEDARKRNALVFFVVNPFRPGFSTIEGIEENFSHLSDLSAMKPDFIIANPNLSGSTDKDSFNDGLKLVDEFSNKSGVEVAFCVAENKLANELTGNKLNAPEFFQFSDRLIFAINRYWDTPWHFGVNANH
ncbi:MAG: hypothetical protein ACQETH_02525 [Candidatus Rifleibacteriota bacterium]